MEYSIDTFNTHRLIAECVLLADYDELCRMHCDPMTMATLGGVRSHEETREFLRSKMEHWEAHGYGLWVFRERSRRRFIGRGLLEHIEVGGKQEVEVGYSVGAEHWGMGSATEMARALLAIGFNTVGLESIVSFSLVDNHASRRVMEKAGFTFERTVDHVGHPHVLYRIVREEYGGDSNIVRTERVPVIE